MDQENPLTAFYPSALAHNYAPDDYEKDREGVWQLKAVNSKNRPRMRTESNIAPPLPDEQHTAPTEFTSAEAADYQASDDDASSVSSTAAEIGGDTRWVEEGYRSGRAIIDSFLLSRSPTPVAVVPAKCVEAVIAGMGEGLVANDSKTRPSRLVETYGPYQARFVDFRKDQACSKPPKTSISCCGF